MHSRTELRRGYGHYLPGIFRCILILCLIPGSSWQVRASVGYQEARFTVHVQKGSLQAVFEQVQQQSSFRFTYMPKVVEKAKPVTIRLKHATLQEVLTQAFRDQPLQYTINEKVITVSARITTPSTTRPTSPTSIPGSDTLITVSGRVLSGMEGTPLPGATVRVVGTETLTRTDGNGFFQLQMPSRSFISITYVGFQPREARLPEQYNGGLFTVRLVEQETALEGVEVVSSGYQSIPKERATGSFVQLDNRLINRRVGTGIIDRLEGITSGLIFNANADPQENESPFSIRGRSTLFANTKPLIVIDNFPYEGDINNLNPNDVESITVLKDAAAASIWGARSGNGVIVITTKSGKRNSAVSVTLNSNLNFGKKPDLFYHPWMSNKDYIAVEQYMFDRGFFNGSINANPRGRLSPAVNLFLRHRNGEISESDMQAEIKQLESYDIRRDQSQYFYRPSLHQQHNLSLTGGSNVSSYYFSAGIDQNRTFNTGNDYNRFTVNGKNTVSIIKNKLELTSHISFSTSREDQNSVNLGTYYPYARLADEAGNSLPIYNQNGLGKEYIDTVGQGLLLDWAFRPLDELRYANSKTNLTDYRINTVLRYRVLSGLEASVYYQFNKGLRERRTLQPEESFFTRDLINQFAQLDYATGSVTNWVVPRGGILDVYTDKYTAHNLRGQLSYTRDWSERHSLSAIAGAEMSDYQSTAIGNRLYGYDERNGTNVPVDVVNSYLIKPLGIERNLGGSASETFFVNRYISYYGNASYTFKKRYTISGSARKDESNLFGVRANQRGVPLWSVGGSWEISKESFYRFTGLPYLKLRLTYGYNGNIDKSVSAYTTAKAEVPNTNRYGALQFEIVNPPNPDLRWEKIAVVNLGIDFKSKNDVLTGSIELYHKSGKDLIGNIPFAANTGVTLFKGNNSNMVTKGVDLVLNTQNIRGKFSWSTNLLLSYAADEVTKYLPKPGTLATFVGQDFNYPYEGRPYNSIFALRWAGLDPATGAPMGYVDGETSMDYSRLRGILKEEELLYMGPGRPQFFGALRNNFGYKGLSLSFNITYKFKYYFKRYSVNYNALVSTFGGSAIQPDFAERWQKPADELRTNVPAFYYPVNLNRELFYADSELLVEKGDHVRLQDIRLGYDLSHVLLNRIVKRVELYVYANNLGLIWKATDSYIDPDFNSVTSSSFVAPKTFAIGATVNF